MYNSHYSISNFIQTHVFYNMLFLSKEIKLGRIYYLLQPGPITCNMWITWGK